MTTLTETREARRIAVRQETLNMLYHKHGTGLADFWSREFGHGIDCLTSIEAEYQRSRVCSPRNVKAELPRSRDRETTLKEYEHGADHEY
jgi:hypothetical protein